MISIDTKDIKGKVYKTLKEKIINLDFKPGEILSDRKLSEYLNVSRTPVREALNLLVKENYVRHSPGRGFWVNEISLKNVTDMYEVRKALETAALKEAARLDVTKDVARIDKLLKHHKKIIMNFRPQGKFLEDAEFHKALVMMSGNKYLFEILESIFNRIEMLRNIEGVSQERVKVALDQHLQIFDLFSKGLFSRAEEMLCKHIQDSKDDIINRIKNRFEIIYL
jgi:DNA-binding GntR family transcriptional regulator